MDKQSGIQTSDWSRGKTCLLNFSEFILIFQLLVSDFSILYRTPAFTFISPPPVKPEGTIGLHSVRQSVPLSVRPSHSFSGLFFAMLWHICMKVGSVCPSVCPSVTLVFRTFLRYALTHLHESWFSLSLCLSVRHTRFPDFSSLCSDTSAWKLVSSFYMKSYISSSTSITIDQLFRECPLFKIRFLDFSRLCVNISEWKLVASFHMNSYRSSSTFITVDLLFHELLPFVQIRFPDFSRLYFYKSQWRLIESFHMKSYRSSSTFVTVDLLFHELLPFVQNLFPGLMVADLNLLMLVGDLYCFSNTLSMLVSCLFQQIKETVTP